MSEINSDLSFQKLKSNLGMCEQNEKQSSDMLNYAIESCTSLCLISSLGRFLTLEGPNRVSDGGKSQGFAGITTFFLGKSVLTRYHINQPQMDFRRICSVM